MSHEHKQHLGTLSVTGDGSVTARPDIASVRLGASSQAKTAGEATAHNAEVATRIIAAIQGVGIDAAAIHTAALSLEPVYEWDEPGKRNVLVGYRASNSVVVRAPIDKAAEVFDAGVNAGANEGTGVAFGLRDDGELRKKALQLATSDALERIQLVAQVLKVDLLGPLEVQIFDSEAPQAAELVRKVASTSTPIMPGELEIHERVRVVFQTRM